MGWSWSESGSQWEGWVNNVGFRSGLSCKWSMILIRLCRSLFWSSSRLRLVGRGMNDRPLSNSLRCGVVGMNNVARLRMLDMEVQPDSWGDVWVVYVWLTLVNVNLIVASSFEKLIVLWWVSIEYCLFLCWMCHVVFQRVWGKRVVMMLLISVRLLFWMGMRFGEKFIMGK